MNIERITVYILLSGRCCNTQLCARYNVTNLLESFGVRPLTLAAMSLAKVYSVTARVMYAFTE